MKHIGNMIVLIIYKKKIIIILQVRIINYREQYKYKLLW